MIVGELKARRGYTVADLRRVFGENAEKVWGWIDRGLLGKPVRRSAPARFSERAVARFIRDHPAEYSLARVDRERFLALLGLPSRHRSGQRSATNA